MLKIFDYDGSNNSLTLNLPELLLVREFAALLEPSRNKCKEDPKGTHGLRAFREFTYIYLALDWASIYHDFDELDRHNEAMADSELTEEEFDDETFREACRKYTQIQNEIKSIKMLKSVEGMVDRLIDYFSTIDPLERDPETKKPLFKVKDIQTEIISLPDLNKSLVTLRNAVMKDIQEDSVIRGGGIEDFDPGDF